MGRVGNKNTGSKAAKTSKSRESIDKNAPKKAGVSKAKSKSRAKQTKAQIEKLNQDVSTITSIHMTLSKHGQAPKEINVLDAKSLREGMEKDQFTKTQSEKAEKDLASQLELITGMAL